MKKLSMLLLSFVLSMALCLSAVAGQPGDNGVSYKGNTAYLISTAGDGPDKVETWVLRTGSQDQWDNLKVMMYNGLYRIDMMFFSGNHGWVKRTVVKIGYIGFDTGWVIMTEDDIVNRSLSDDIVVSVRYFQLGDDDFEYRGTSLTEFKISTKEFIESMIYKIAHVEYIDGQEGL